MEEVKKIRDIEVKAAAYIDKDGNLRCHCCGSKIDGLQLIRIIKGTLGELAVELYKSMILTSQYMKGMLKLKNE